MTPSFFKRRLKFSPAAAANPPLKPPTCTGVDLSPLVPSPNCPKLFFPQAHAVPSALMARLWELPPEIATTSVKPVARTTTFRCVVLPSPRFPNPLYPHPHTV